MVTAEIKTPESRLIQPDEFLRYPDNQMRKMRPAYITSANWGTSTVIWIMLDESDSLQGNFVPTWLCLVTVQRDDRGNEDVKYWRYETEESGVALRHFDNIMEADIARTKRLLKMRDEMNEKILAAMKLQIDPASLGETTGGTLF